MKIRHISPLLAALIPAAALAIEPAAWPGLEKDAPCLTQKWPESRTLVWAKPGESGTAQETGNWTEYVSSADYKAGKPGGPAASGPDANTDLVLPDAPAGKPYVVGFMVAQRERARKSDPDAPALFCRHVTIGSGAALDGGMGMSRGSPRFSDWPTDDTAIGIAGNVTVADGGSLYGPLYMLGGKPTWLLLGKSPEPLARRLIVRKSAGASVTLMARQFDLLEGLTVETGRLVLAPQTALRTNAGLQARIDLKKLSKLGFGKFEPYVWVRQGAALEMQPGSRLGRVKPPADPAADLRVEGLLEIGPAGQTSDAPAVIELTMAEGDGGYLNQPGGLYIQPTGEVRNHGVLSIAAADPNAATATRGVSIFLEKAVDFGKVTIDHLRAGGIAATDPAAAKKATASATFGKRCAATGEALYSKIELTDFAGGPGTVEFVDGLTTECEILFPLAGRLVVRAKANRTVQSFDLKTVHAVSIAGRRTEYHAKRGLTAEEKRLREVNALWADSPGAGQIGAYGKQDWPKRPLMVWRRPGVAGSRFVAPNWLDEKGRPCFEAPIGVDEGPEPAEADILLPAADTYYQVGGDRPQWRIRHMTIENNAKIFLTYNIGGNFWMKDGSGIQAPWFGAYRNTNPGVHRFLRFDGLRIGPPARGQTEPQREPDMSLSQWGSYVTGPDGTLEIIGINQVNDQFTISGEGRLIISENSFLAPGARACCAIVPGATVVLLQDASVSFESTCKQDGKASVWVGGTLMIGTPERPITRDMAFRVSGMEEDKIIRNPAGNIRTPGVSLLVSQGGRLVMHSADPTKARLVFKMHDSDKAKERGKKWGDPKGIVLAFFGAADLDGVVFHNLLEKGLMVSPEQRAKWKNVTYASDNAGPPEKLYYDLKP